MAGTPGSGSGSSYAWQPYPSPSLQGGDSQRLHLEAALRALREQRPQIAAEIGEYLYSLVLQGQLRDPIVVATCRRLYDYEQQVTQLEANLRAIPAVSMPIGQPPASVPPAANHPPGLPPIPASPGGDDSATVVAPAGRSSHDADVTRIVPGTSSGDAGRQRGAPSSHDVPSPRRPADRGAGAAKPAERRCTHCRMPLRANDTSCPVCGRAVVEQVAESPQCRRCGTELRSQDRTCPVCGTPRT